MNALQEAILDAEVLQSVLEEADGRSGPERGVGGTRNAARDSAVPAIPAVLALRRAADGTGDLYTHSVGPASVATLFGVSARELLRHRLGRAAAAAEGRDPGGFPTDLDRGLLGPVPVPGAAMQVMAGAALAMRMRGEDRVALLVDTLAATSSGDWHEGFNFAAVSRAPLVVVVAPLHVGREVHTAVDRLTRKATGYGVGAFSAPWDDLDRIRDTIEKAVAASRAGAGVSLVEITVSPTGAQIGSFERSGLERAEFDAEVSRRVEETRTLLAEVREESAAPPAAALGPVYPDAHADIPWTRRPELRPR